MIGKLFGIGTKQKTEENNYPFFIEELPDRFRMYNVPRDNKLHTYDWSKEHLDGGRRHTQDEWTQLLQGQEFQLASGPEYHATMKTLYLHKDSSQSSLVRKVCTLFKKDFANRGYWMTTSTRIRYNSSFPDVVIHNYNTAHETSVDVNLVGPDGYIADSSFEYEMEALLGTRDCQEVDAVYKWISGKKSYLWRLNQRPFQAAERALVLGIVNVRFYINAIDIISNQRPARGVHEI